VVVGQGKVGGGPSQAIIYSGAPGVTPLANDTVSSTVTSLSQVVCPSASVCVGIGTAGSAPEILSGSTVSGAAWSLPAAAGIPSSVTALSAITCPNVTTCAISALATSGGTSGAAILSGTPGIAAKWSSVALPAADAGTLYLTGIACTPTNGTATCSAVGATATGAVILTSTGGPGGTWADHSNDVGLNLAGNPTSNIPVDLQESGITNANNTTGGWDPVSASTTAPGHADATALTDIYPFASAYGVYAADCTTEATAASMVGSTVTATPGATSSTPAATVPLGVIALEVTTASGAPESGDTLTLTATTAGTGCGADAYSLQTTGPDGLSRTEVPFGTYTLTIRSGANSRTTTGVVVAPGSVTVGSPVALPQVPTVVGL
jgi:hypothetical protein